MASGTKRHWRKWLLWGLAGAFLVWLLILLGLLLAVQQTGTVDEAQPVDVIVVLGAGLTRDGRPGYALTRRSIHAAQLYAAGYADTVICTGGKTRGSPRSEADACREILLWRGVPASAILLEDESRSTEENALHTQAILEEHGWERVLLVSDSYHMFRAGLIFESRGVPVLHSPVPQERMSRRDYAYAVFRELVALHWQAFKDLFNIQVTHISLL